MKLLICLMYLTTAFMTGEGLPPIKFESAPYVVVKNYEGFEERLYPARTWVTTSMEGNSTSPMSRNPMFEVLLGYLQGENDQNVKIPMTSPISTLVEPLDSAYLYTMAFYVPSAFQEDVPNGEPGVVAIENRPRLNILTREFGGYATEENVDAEREALEGLIRSAGLGEEVDFSTYYIATYTPPVKPVNRKNEVWFVRQAPAANAV